VKTYLLFRLYGPMCAWGDIAVGEQRPSAGHPSKSAVLGLLAAALGVRRDEEDRQKSLADAYAMAVRVDASGELLRDYHTAQVPPERRGVRYYTRQDELRSDKLNTILSQRDYRMDASYSVAVWAKNDSPPWALSDVQSALTVCAATPSLFAVPGQKILSTFTAAASPGYQRGYAQSGVRWFSPRG